jgi:predicted nucleotidyltransferase
MKILKQQIDSIKEVIIKNIQPQKLILFGSYAGGTPTKDSDLDLLIIKQNEKPRYKRARDIHRLFNPYPCPMDILWYTPEEIKRVENEKTSLIKKILDKGIVLHEA